MPPRQVPMLTPSTPQRRTICPPRELPDVLRADPAIRAKAAAAVPVVCGDAADWDLSGVETVVYTYGNPDESGDED